MKIFGTFFGAILSLVSSLAERGGVLRVLAFVAMLVLPLGWQSCSVTRHVPEGEHVVSRVKIEQDGVSTSSAELRSAVKQKAYHRTFGFLPVSVWIYNSAGTDTTSRWNRWLHKIGTPPPIYDPQLTVRSERALERTLHARGYMDAQVSHRLEHRDKKVQVTYELKRGVPKVIDRIYYEVEDPDVQPFVELAEESESLQRGALFDRSRLDKERVRITNLLRNEGYWGFNKDNIRFIADTVEASPKVDLTVVVEGRHRPYTVRDVWFVTDFDLLSTADTEPDTTLHTVSIAKGYHLRYSGRECYLNAKTLLENTYVLPDEYFSEQSVQDTYAAYSRLQALKYVNIRMQQVAQDSLDCIIYMSPSRPHSIRFEVEGTNSAGDLGFAAACTYRHANVFRGSETYTASVKGGYESLSGNLSDLVNDNYQEFTVENTLNIPKFLFPFFSPEQRRKSRASTLIRASYSHQSRPEYTRIITNGMFGYNWFSEDRRMRHVWEVGDLSYVHLPKRSSSFVDIIENAGPISYASYQSHLILAMGYNFYYGNVSSNAATAQRRQYVGDVWTLRVGTEVGGNTLQALSRLLSLPYEDNAYRLFDLRFEQYAGFDADFAYSRYLTDRSRLAFHLAGGVSVPYGNSNIMPFEKRYYTGGANNVRGWSVRSLGPGGYRGNGSSLDYFNRCGDLRMDMSMELRSRLFWNFEFAAFLDAGNVWTLEEYASQPGGAISGDFYKQIAASWGVGLRLVTDFMVLRLDLGVKAHDPAFTGRDAWVIDDPLNRSNRTLHFAVGYPF